MRRWVIAKFNFWVFFLRNSKYLKSSFRFRSELIVIEWLEKSSILQLISKKKLSYVFEEMKKGSNWFGEGSHWCLVKKKRRLINYGCNWLQLIGIITGQISGDRTFELIKWIIQSHRRQRCQSICNRSNAISNQFFPFIIVIQSTSNSRWSVINQLRNRFNEIHHFTTLNSFD